MVDINKIFDLHNRIDEIERHKQLFNELDRSRFSAFDQQRNALTQIVLKSNRDLHSPMQDLQNHLRDLHDPTKNPRNHLEDIAKPFKSFDNLRLTEKSISQSFLEKVGGLEHSSIHQTRKMIEETFSPFSRNNLISERIKNDFERLRKSLLSPLHSQHSDLLRGFEQATKATTLSSVEALSKTFLDNSLSRNERLLNQVSNSLFSYDRFANNTLAKLSLDIDKYTALALKGSLTLANEQMLRSTSAIQSYIESSNTSAFNKSNPFFDREFPKINRYRIQKQELLRRDDIEEDEEYESLVIKSDAAISFEQISNCMTLIGLCNEASETTKGNTIFTLTSTLWLSAWKLTGVVPTNKDSFAIIVDCLYLMLYEGAGKDKLRFIEQGYIDATEAELIWKIKHLRNKWLRHDIDHGKETDIKKSHQHRKEALEWLGLGKVPYSKDEFIFLYNSLMLRVEEFLKLLLERVSKFSN
jgi:hypothetical protein